ncbi:MAG: tRNA (guanosine(46)-N7)-methyltransferase TrmB [Spirochaetota bacterium]
MSEYRDPDHIKSYARRATRMSRHQRDAYERLCERYCVPRSETPVDPRSLFPDPDLPVILEIGFGMGAATAELAASMPGVNFLGVEVYKPGVGKLLSLIEQGGLENVRIVHDDAILVLEQMIRQGSLDGIHLFFPDPWPKKRHHKRRIVRPALARAMASRLRPGGYLYMVTDWEEYARVALDVLEETPGLENPYDGFAPPREWRPQTAFEAKGRRADRPIIEIYVLRGPA